MGVLCSDSLVSPRFTAPSLHFENTDENDLDINALVSVKSRNGNIYKRKIQCNKRQPCALPVLSKHLAQQKKHRYSQSCDLIMRDQDGNKPTISFPIEKMIRRSKSERVTFQQNKKIDSIRSTFDLTDDERKVKIKKILETIFLARVGRMLDQSVDELMLQMTPPKEQKPIKVSSSSKSSSCDGSSGHNSTRSNVKERKSETGSDTNSRKSHSNRHQANENIVHDPKYRSSIQAEPTPIKPIQQDS